jgi:hypothetical protein
LTPNLGDSQATVRAEIRGRFEIAVLDQCSVVELPVEIHTELNWSFPQFLRMVNRYPGENQALNQHSCLKD